MVRLPLAALQRREPPIDSCFGKLAWEKKLDFEEGQRQTAKLLWCRGSSNMLRGRSVRLEDAYDIEDKVLGEGGFGKVRRAHPINGGQTCAVKSISKHSSQAADSAYREAELLRQLDHPSICKFQDIFEDSDHIHLVLEYVNGHELFDEIAEQVPMEEARAVGVMRHVFEAIAHCHESEPSIIHRDLKPENIMLIPRSGDTSAPPEVKLIDFGLAETCHDYIETPLVGTADYLAPEAFLTGKYSKASDLWSVGVVLHMMLTGGQLPPQDADHQSFEDLSISAQARHLLRCLLRKRAQDRISASEALQHPWLRGEQLGNVNCISSSCVKNTDVDTSIQHQPPALEIPAAWLVVDLDNLLKNSYSMGIEAKENLQPPHHVQQCKEHKAKPLPLGTLWQGNTTCRHLR